MAAGDLRLAELALDATPPVIGGALYHCQQAAEKALKAFLIWRQVRYPLTHDLGELLSLCSPLARLTRYFLPASYAALRLLLSR